MCEALEFILLIARYPVLVLSLAAVAGLVPRPARGCGPDFDPEILFDRAATLADLPDGTFVIEAMHLLPAPEQKFAVVEQASEPPGARVGGARETALYAAAAKTFLAGDWQMARRQFFDVLGLPAEERRRFSAFAAFMLGRIARSENESRRHFAQLRDLVQAGFDDPLGLAVASYGEEARGLLAAEDDIGAVRLYAIQAAHGSKGGAVSLLLVARALVANQARLERALPDPVVQRLLTTYAWTRGQEFFWGSGEAAGRPPPPSDLIAVLARVPRLAGADRLAAAAWRMGRFDLARRFAERESTPLGLWVQAKLALRRGQTEASERLIAQAEAGFSAQAARDATRPHGDSADTDTRAWFDAGTYGRRAAGDAAILALARGDFISGMEHVVDSCSYPDIAYLAERVLMLDELSEFLNRHAARLKHACVDQQSWPVGRADVTVRLRELLARRMLRSGRGTEALAAFEGGPNSQIAREYVLALAKARGRGDRIDRAEALFTASQIARRHGLEILGTEVGPDWGWVAGQYDLGDYGASRGLGAFSSAEPVRPSEAAHEFPPSRIKAALPLPDDMQLSLRTLAERARFVAHTPPHAERFHYRQTAADLAEAASELVPARSQAYAAILCHAAKHVASAAFPRTEALWSRYIRRGAVIPGATLATFNFGATCPQPQFERARQMAAQGSRGPHRWPWSACRRRTRALIAGLLALGILGGLIIQRRWRAGAGTPN
jgi:hypothetical protein